MTFGGGEQNDSLSVGDGLLDEFELVIAEAELVDSQVVATFGFDVDDGGLPMLSIFGGKITTYRKLSEEALDILMPRLGSKAPDWTAGAPLPGGDLQQAGKLVATYDFDAFSSAFRAAHGWLPTKLAQRYARCYGTRATRMLDGAKSMQELGEELSPGVFEQEARYLFDVEWARSAEDILWRRTKCGLHCQPHHAARLQQWLEARAISERASPLPA